MIRVVGGGVRAAYGNGTYIVLTEVELQHMLHKATTYAVNDS